MATDSIVTKKIFSDIPTNMTVHPKKKDLLMITNEEAVKRSIKNLISTNLSERPFQPTIGSNILGLLFENFDVLTMSRIENAVETAILNHEPRAKLIKVEVSPNLDNNKINVGILFSIVGSSKPINFNVLLERQR